MKKKAKEYNARGERMYENPIKRENAKKTEKINKNKMKKTKASVGAVPTLEDKIKKGILNMTLKKIDNILEKSDDIDRTNLEFYNMIGKTYGPQTVFEQQRITKRIDAFRRDIGKRWGEVRADKEEIRTTMTILYELSEIRREHMGVAEEEQMSWADIRQEIRDKMKNSFCM